jgi:ribosomal protein S18 acetylase RimI-like enzyme
MGKITFQHEHLDYYDGQNNYELGIYEDGEVIGYVQYVTYKDEITISDILIRPDRRREGFGSMLVKKMKELHPELTYKPSYKTDLGSKFQHKDIEINEQIDRIKKIIVLIN